MVEAHGLNQHEGWLGFLHRFDYGRASGILWMLRNKEHTSMIIEMPDVEEHLFFRVLCQSSPVEW